MTRLRYGILIAVLLAEACSPAAVATPTPEPRSPIPPTQTPAPPSPTEEPTEAPPPPAFEPPAGFVLYQDSVTGITVYVPESWVVTGIIPGEFAILQSYPEDKYVGGEAREPGDTKCDLTIRPPDVSLADAVQSLRSDSFATIVSEQEIVLASGEMGIRMEVESMGPSMSMFTEVNGRTVVLTCFGDFAQFDDIATTLGATE